MSPLPEFTPAARRALDAAATWHASGSEHEIGGPEFLLGLLDEPECRAARMLSRAGIDASVIANKWSVARNGTETAARPSRRLSPELQFGLARVATWARLDDRPAALATEHLLLALAESETGVTMWLAEVGLTTAALRNEIDQLYGRAPNEIGPPIDMPEDGRAKLPLSRHGSGEDMEEPEAPFAHSSTGASPCQFDVPLLRILDAAANRASEGLRVVEDYARFALDDRHLMRLVKELRHDLTAALADVPTAARMAARETQADVGAEVHTAAEFARADLAAVAMASGERVAQSLRSLEEYAKLLGPVVAARLSALRYRHYTFQRALQIVADSRTWLANARLYVLVDGGADEADFARRVQELVAAGVDVLQLRDKRLDDRTLLARGRRLRELTHGSSTLFIMNDRPDLAALCRADGVHIGQEELPVKEARTIVGADALIGVSTHSLEQARRAVLDGANYLGVGPTFSSGTKSFASYPGLELVQSVAGEIGLPWFAIGGIGPENIDRVLQAGATRVAVSGAVWESESPERAAGELKRRLIAATSLP